MKKSEDTILLEALINEKFTAELFYKMKDFSVAVYQDVMTRITYTVLHFSVFKKKHIEDKKSIKSHICIDLTEYDIESVVKTLKEYLSDPLIVNTSNLSQPQPNDSHAECPLPHKTQEES